MYRIVQWCDDNATSDTYRRISGPALNSIVQALNGIAKQIVPRCAELLRHADPAVMYHCLVCGQEIGVVESLQLQPALCIRGPVDSYSARDVAEGVVWTLRERASPCRASVAQYVHG